MPVLFLNSSKQYSTSLTSKSCPPSYVSPLVERTSFIPPPTMRTVTSNVPPPKSKIKIFLSSGAIESSSNARLAAVGSLIILRTFRPAIFPASYVAAF